jgi:mRNA interferase MazF
VGLGRAALKRGELWTIAGGGPYGTKPRPGIVIQDDRYGATEAVLVCPVTTYPGGSPFPRLPLGPSAENGLQVDSHVMLDRLYAIGRAHLGRRVGQLDAADQTRVDAGLREILGLGSGSGVT